MQACLISTSDHPIQSCQQASIGNKKKLETKRTPPQHHRSGQSRSGIGVTAACISVIRSHKPVLNQAHAFCQVASCSRSPDWMRPPIYQSTMYWTALFRDSTSLTLVLLCLADLIMLVSAVMDHGLKQDKAGLRHLSMREHYLAFYWMSSIHTLIQHLLGHYCS